MKQTNKFLNKKFYKAKNPQKRFFCVLCRAPREMSLGKKLTLINYLQILVISCSLGFILYPLMKLKVVFVLFIVWAIFETVKKILYRKEVPCPYCGFDATWYRRDVKVAKKMVENFWDEKNSSNENKSLPHSDHLNDIDEVASHL